MVDAMEVASDVTAGATVLAGLILVYLGALSSSFGTYDAQQKSSVRGRYQMRAGTVQSLGR